MFSTGMLDEQTQEQQPWTTFQYADGSVGYLHLPTGYHAPSLLMILQAIELHRQMALSSAWAMAPRVAPHACLVHPHTCMQTYVPDALVRPPDAHGGAFWQTSTSSTLPPPQSSSDDAEEPELQNLPPKPRLPDEPGSNLASWDAPGHFSQEPAAARPWEVFAIDTPAFLRTVTPTTAVPTPTPDEAEQRVAGRKRGACHRWTHEEEQQIGTRRPSLSCSGPPPSHLTPAHAPHAGPLVRSALPRAPRRRVGAHRCEPRHRPLSRVVPAALQEAVQGSTTRRRSCFEHDRPRAPAHRRRRHHDASASRGRAGRLAAGCPSGERRAGRCEDA